MRIVQRIVAIEAVANQIYEHVYKHHMLRA